jgi:hypothetical protein
LRADCIDRDLLPSGNDATSLRVCPPALAKHGEFFSALPLHRLRGASRLSTRRVKKEETMTDRVTGAKLRPWIQATRCRIRDLVGRVPALHAMIDSVYAVGRADGSPRSRLTHPRLSGATKASCRAETRAHSSPRVLWRTSITVHTGDTPAGRCESAGVSTLVDRNGDGCVSVGRERLPHALRERVA